MIVTPDWSALPEPLWLGAPPPPGMLAVVYAPPRSTTAVVLKAYPEAGGAERVQKYCKAQVRKAERPRFVIWRTVMTWPGGLYTVSGESVTYV